MSRELLGEIEALRGALEHLRTDDAFKSGEADLAKGAGIAEALLDRAEATLLDRLPDHEWAWVHDGFTPPEGMIDQAREVVEALQAGRDPYYGRFCEPGGTAIDHCLIKRGDEHHLIYIRGTACKHWPEAPSDDFGHATSRDLIHWRVHEPVLKSPQSGWDEWQVWAPHVVEHEGAYWMLYTGVNRNAAQAIGLARSADLFTWERVGDGPVIKPGPWGAWSAEAWSDCRDPQMLKVGGRFYCYYTCRYHLPDEDRHGSCIGIASSADLREWRDEGFFAVAKSDTPPESPFAVEKDGKLYLFYTEYGSGTVVAESDDPVRGWKDREGPGRVAMAGVSASEVYRDGDQWYISAITHEPNALHFFEIFELAWNADGTFSTEPVAKA